MLLRALAVLAVVAVPVLLVFAVAPSLLLRLAFGEETRPAADALLVLGAGDDAAGRRLPGVQYMLALREPRFLFVLGVVAVAEPSLLTAPGFGLVGVRDRRARAAGGGGARPCSRSGSAPARRRPRAAAEAP